MDNETNGQVESRDGGDNYLDKRYDMDKINDPSVVYWYDIEGGSGLKGLIPSDELLHLPEEKRDAIARQELHSMLRALSSLDHRRVSLREEFLRRHRGFVRKNPQYMLGLFRPA